MFFFTNSLELWTSQQWAENLELILTKRNMLWVYFLGKKINQSYHICSFGRYHWVRHIWNSSVKGVFFRDCMVKCLFFCQPLFSITVLVRYITQQIQTKYIIVRWALSNPGVGGWRHHCIFTSTWPSLLHDEMSNVGVSWRAERWINGLQRKSRRLREVQVHTLSLTSLSSMYSNVLSGLS